MCRLRLPAGAGNLRSSLASCGHSGLIPNLPNSSRVIGCRRSQTLRLSVSPDLLRARLFDRRFGRLPFQQSIRIRYPRNGGAAARKSPVHSRDLSHATDPVDQQFRRFCCRSVFRSIKDSNIDLSSKFYRFATVAQAVTYRLRRYRIRQPLEDEDATKFLSLRKGRQKGQPHDRIAAPQVPKLAKSNSRSLSGLRLKPFRAVAGADRNRTRLFAFRDIANEIDVQQSVLEVGSGHIDVVGKLVAAFEGASRDAAMQIGLFARSRRPFRRRPSASAP